MEKLFIAKIAVTKSYYMGDDVTSDETRLVIADSEKEAEMKAEKYFEDKTDEYSVYYSANCYECNAVIF